MLVPLLGGCWVVLGESFTGYTNLVPSSDAGDAGDATGTTDAPITTDAGDGGGAIDAAFDAAPHPIDDCTPRFVVANGIQYPAQAPPALDITSTLQVDTDTYAGCIPVAGPSTPYCLLLFYELHIGVDAKLQTAGSRPLVVMTVQNLTMENNALLDVAGGDTGSFPGAGPHTKGAATGPGGGGGNAEPGGGSTCGATGGSPIEIGLFAGGNGGGALDARQGCRVGGSGGGAVQLVSLCGTITIRGTIEASGGGGGGGAMADQGCPDGYGGGAGGTVWMQSDKKIVFDSATAAIKLSGGGGGGGACRPTAADPWTSGGAASRADAGVGGTCAGATGGPGGVGGVGGQAGAANPPGTGAQGTGDARCGGGGGARGRLVLQAPETTCADVVSTGVCSP